MATKLTIRYDKVGDILFIDKVRPYAEQDSDELGDEVAARFNPTTGEIENLEIMWFKRRLEKGETIELPVTGELRLVV